MLRLIATVLLLAAPAVAQPYPVQILSALVQQAPTLDAVDPYGDPLGDGAAIAFVTQALYELGINAPQTEDDVSFTAECEPTDDPARWACQVVLAVQWDNAESAWLAMFDMMYTRSRTCPMQRVDGFGLYEPCEWTIAGDRITLMFAG